MTIAPQAWLVERLGGDRFEVQTLVGPGESAETFSPSDAQVTRLTRSALYFRMRVPAENAPWFGAIEALDRPRVVDLRQGLPLREIEGGHHHHHHHQPGEKHEHGDEAPDPHTWLSPTRLQTMARTAARALGELDPEHADVYTANLEQLVSDLTSLESDIRATLAGCEKPGLLRLSPGLGLLRG